MPKRRRGESLEDYLKRGHRALASEFPDPRQRHAVLMRQVSKSMEGAILEGTRVEMEHTENELEAARIALDHLEEDPYYYVKLRALEKGLTGSGDSCYDVGKGDDMDAEVRKALDGAKRLIRIANAAMPEGTVTHRKDGDWKKVGGQWEKVSTGTSSAAGVKGEPANLASGKDIHGKTEADVRSIAGKKFSLADGLKVEVVGYKKSNPRTPIIARTTRGGKVIEFKLPWDAIETASPINNR